MTTEAPVSQTIKIIYKGCEILLTQRDLEVKMLPFLEQAQKLIDGALLMGFEALPVRGSFGMKKSEAPKEYMSYPCPKCGKRVVKGTTKTGKIFEACETRSYNFATKVTEGCDYIVWKTESKG